MIVVTEPDDDIASLRTRLSEWSGARVALVLLDESDALDGPVAIHLLARIATRESLRLAIVTGRADVRSLAKAEGMVAFPSTSHLPRPNGRPARSLASDVIGGGRLIGHRVGRSFVWLGSVLIALVLLLVGLLLIPRAVVTVRPLTDVLQSDQRINASVDATQVDATQGVVPGRSVYLSVDASGSIPIKGGDRVLDGHAIGYETFENRTSDAISIPKGTVIATFSGMPFATTAATALAARPGATIVVPIRAVFPGTAANVRRGEIVQIQGNLRWRVVAVNEAEVAGGGRPGESIVTSWDVEKVSKQVAAEAQRDARIRLADQATDGEMPVDGSVEVTPIDESFDHLVGSTADSLTLAGQFRASAMIVDENRIQQLALQRWRPVVRPGYDLQTSTIGADRPRVVEVNPTSATFDVAVHGIAYQTINATRVTRYVRLRSPDAASRDLAGLYGLGSPPSIAIVPNWLGRAYRVEIDVVTSAAPAGGR